MRSATPRCGLRQAGDVSETGSSPSPAFAGLALPVRATSGYVAVLASSVLARILDDFMTVPRLRRG
jgi:hypothetical protein